MNFLWLSLLAMLSGFVLDLLLGDPHWLPHPVRLIGLLISGLEKGLRAVFPKTPRGERIAGVLLALIVTLLAWAIPCVILWLAWRCQPVLYFLLEMVMCYQILAVTSLKKESMAVLEQLQHGTLETARRAVSMIVGRDTASLDRAGVARAAVETVAENTSDGVVAPLLFLAVGGAPLGFFYKAVNTMDSMVGYKNERYLFFGWAAAKLDDIMNFLPSRLSAWLMIACCGEKKFDRKNAVRIYRRDRCQHASPNSAQTESVCAGALHLRLAGDNFYFGKLCHKPYIGDDDRPIVPEDIARANILMQAAAVLALALSCAWRGIWLAVLSGIL